MQKTKNEIVEKSRAMKKVVLAGGCGVANDFYVVNLISIEDESGQQVANLETANCRLPNPFKPRLGSWEIAELADELKDLPLGHYLHLGDRIADAESGGLFSSIYQLRTVKILGSGHALGPRESSRRELAEGSDGPGPDETRERCRKWDSTLGS
jgi:hypothetical protein